MDSQRGRRRTPAVGVPSEVAQRRLADAVEREVGDLRDGLREGLLWSSVLSRLGQTRAAAGVLAEQRGAVQRFEHRVVAAIAAAAVEREAESVVADEYGRRGPFAPTEPVRGLARGTWGRGRSLPRRVTRLVALTAGTALAGLSAAFAVGASRPTPAPPVVAAPPEASPSEATLGHLAEASKALDSLAAGDVDVLAATAQAHRSLFAAASQTGATSSSPQDRELVAAATALMDHVLPLLTQERDLLEQLAADGDPDAADALTDLRSLVAQIVAVLPPLDLPAFHELGASPPVEVLADHPTGPVATPAEPPPTEVLVAVVEPEPRERRGPRRPAEPEPEASPSGAGSEGTEAPPTGSEAPSEEPQPSDPVGTQEPSEEPSEPEPTESEPTTKPSDAPSEGDDGPGLDNLDLNGDD